MLLSRRLDSTTVTPLEKNLLLARQASQAATRRSELKKVYPDTMGKLKDSWEKFQVWSNREPILTIRVVLWVVLNGWALFVAYSLAALGMMLTIIFIPFGIQAFKFAFFALNPLTKEPYYEELSANIRTKPWNNPIHPFTIAANVVWLALFGWGIAMAHLFSALIQALTIIGIGTAVKNVQLAAFAVWPFGRSIRNKFLPTTLEELRMGRMGAEQMAPHDIEAQKREMPGAQVSQDI